MKIVKGKSVIAWELNVGASDITIEIWLKSGKIHRLPKIARHSVGGSWLDGHTSNTKASAIIRERDKSELEDEQHSRLLVSANPFSSTVGFGNEITFKSRLLSFFFSFTWYTRPWLGLFFSSATNPCSSKNQTYEACAVTNVSINSFSLLVKPAGQVYRKHSAVPAESKCYISPKYYPFGHSITM